MHKNKFSLVKKVFIAMMLLVNGFFYFSDSTYAVNLHDLIATKNILLRSSEDTWRQGDFDGDGVSGNSQYFNKVIPNWPYLDNRQDRTPTEKDTNAVSTYSKVIKTPVLSTDDNIPVIPREYNDLNFMIPKNYNKYSINGKDDLYSHLENLLPPSDINNIHVWPGRNVNGFTIKDHSKPASFVIKKITYTNGNWIDLLYTIKLSGSGKNLGGKSPWSSYINNSGSFDDSRDVGIALGSDSNPDPSDWLKVSTNAAGSRDNNNPSAKWYISIKFLYDKDVKACKTNDEINNLEPVKLNGTYQAFNVNQRKGFAFDKNDLAPINKNGTTLPRIWAFNDQSSGNTKVKGHLDTNEKSFDLMGNDSDNSGTRNDLAFMYLFNNGQVNWVNYSTGSTPAAMYVNTSNRPVTRSELPFLNLEGTTTRLAEDGQSNIYDSSASIVTPGDKELFTNSTAQFQLLQKFPVQPEGFAPTVFKVNNFTVPNYATINLPKDATKAYPYTIAINSLNDQPIDQLINNDSTKSPQILKEQSTNASQHVYNYELNTTKLLSDQFDGFRDLFIRADLNFQINWDAKQIPDSDNAPYQWEKDVVTHEGVQFVKVKASGVSSNIYRGDSKDATVEKFGTKTPENTSSQSLEQTSYVQVPEKTYQFAYKDKNSNTIIPKDNTLTQPLKQTISSSQTADASSHAPNHLTDSADKDYLFDHATIIKMDSNGTPLGSEKEINLKELASLSLKYDQDHKYKITLYYNGNIGRATFHYWDASTNKTDPESYLGNNSDSIPDELFTLPGGNSTFGDYDQPLQENLPAKTQLVDSSLTNTGNPIPNAPAPSLMASGNNKYLGYYLMANGTATFHSYDPNADSSHNNAQVIGNYQKANQVIVFVYASKYGTVLKTFEPLKFNSQYAFNLQTTNNSKLQFKITDNFFYEDQKLQWPKRNWKVSAQITKFQTESQKSLPKGTTVAFSKPNLTEYTGLGNENIINSALNRATLTITDTQGNTDNVELLNVANLKDQPNSTAAVTTKSESATLSWEPNQISLKIPDANNVEGLYHGEMIWTLSNTP